MAVKKRVALLALEGDFSRSLGEGVQEYMYELYKNMTSIQGRYGFEVSNVEHKVHQRIGRRFSFALHNFFADIRDYDIVHSLTLMPMYNISVTKTIKFMTAHDFQFLFSPELSADKKKGLSGRLMWSGRMLDFATKLTLKSADYLMVNSSQTKDEAVRLGFDSRRIFVASHGIGDMYMAAVGAGRSPGRSKEFKVGYIGSFRTRKNVGFAVRAFMDMQDKNMAFELWGNPRFEYMHLQSLASKDKRIRFMGFAPEDRIVRIFDSFDAFVFPSRHEGEGLPILQAQARGLPVIIYRGGRVPDEIRKYAFEADDEHHMAEILQRLKDNGYSDAQRKKAMSYARKFTWKRTAELTFEAYRKAIAQEGRQ